MNSDRDASTSEIQIDDSWWAGRVGRVLQPVEVQIIEALQWIDRPLSGGELCEVFEGQPQWIAFAHHVRRLSKLHVIQFAERPRPQNPLAIRYRLAVQRENDNR